jgi:hypothetical protein
MATEERKDENQDKSKVSDKDERSSAEEAEHQHAKQLDEGTESPG